MSTSSTRQSTNDQPNPTTPIAPVIKRRRRTSCLGEQERRERKRAIDREAQRSLREKTKTHIAELERTIQILRDQDRDGATASLLSEIDSLRAENERLREVIDSVKSVIGSEVTARAPVQQPAAPPPPLSRRSSDAAEMAAAGPTSPQDMKSTISMIGIQDSGRPPLLSPQPQPQTLVHEEYHNRQFVPISFNAMHGKTSAIDLNGMSMVSDVSSEPSLSVNLDFDSGTPEADMLDAPASPASAAFAPYIAEMFGDSWRGTPLVLHIEDPSRADSDFMLKKESHVVGKVFGHYRSDSAGSLDFKHVGQVCR